MSDEFYYKDAEFKKLSPEHFELLVMGKLSGEEGLEILDKLHADLEVLQPCDGCVPPAFVDGDLERTIWQKFALVVDRAVWLVEQKHPHINLRSIISATYEGDTVVMVIDPERKWVLLDYGIEAWNFKFETLDELITKILEWNAEIVCTYAEHKLATIAPRGAQTNLC